MVRAGDAQYRRLPHLRLVQLLRSRDKRAFGSIHAPDVDETATATTRSSTEWGAGTKVTDAGSAGDHRLCPPG
jgi:hypothetical protein